MNNHGDDIDPRREEYRFLTEVIMKITDLLAVVEVRVKQVIETGKEVPDPGKREELSLVRHHRNEHKDH